MDGDEGGSKSIRKGQLVSITWHCVVVLVHSPPALTTIKKMDCFDNKQTKWLTPKNFVNPMDCFDNKEKIWLTPKTLKKWLTPKTFVNSMDCFDDNEKKMVDIQKSCKSYRSFNVLKINGRHKIICATHSLNSVHNEELNCNSFWGTGPKVGYSQRPPNQNSSNNNWHLHLPVWEEYQPWADRLKT